MSVNVEKNNEGSTMLSSKVSVNCFKSVVSAAVVSLTLSMGADVLASAEAVKVIPKALTKGGCFAVERSILTEKFPGMTFLLLRAKGIRYPSEKSLEQLKANFEEAQQKVAAMEYEASAAKIMEAGKYKHILGWYEALTAAGINPKKTPPSIAKLFSAIKSGAKNGRKFPWINPLVAAYNTAALNHEVCIGGYDLDQVQHELGVRYSVKGEEFIPLGIKDEPETIKTDGEVIFSGGSQNTVITRYFVHIQSKLGCLKCEIDPKEEAQDRLSEDSTRDAFFISEIPASVDPERIPALKKDIEDFLKEHFGAEVSTTLMKGSDEPAYTEQGVEMLAWDLK